MSRVYLVTAGTYSDYRIIAVFSTKELAEEYATWFEGPTGIENVYGNDSVTVEEWSLDEETPTGGVFRWGGALEEAISGGGFFEWIPDENTVRKSSGSEWRSGEITISAYGPTTELARRSATELARAIKAGSVVGVTEYGCTVYKT